MLHHVIEWPRAIAEAVRVLRPGGTLIGYDLTDTRLATMIHLADRSPHRLIGFDEFAPALTQAGLADIKIRRSLRSHLVKFVAQKPT